MRYIRNATALLLVLALACGCARSGTPREPAPGQQPIPGQPGALVSSQPAALRKPCPLCGQPVPENLTRRRPFALMIDNAPLARPQSGLGDACLVYEVLVEGGITRFLAFYLHAEPVKVGPIRSTRPYFLDLVLPLDAVLGHSGASEQGFADLKALGVSHLDEIYGGGEAYWRVPPSERRPPHATYTSGELFRGVMKKRGLEKEGPFPSPFSFHNPGLQPQGKEAVMVTVWYPGGWQGYRVTYTYEKETDRWLRSLGDQPHRDAEGSVLWARNVVIQFVEMRQVPGDPLLHVEAKMTGRGKVMVFSGGRYREGTWRKESRKSPVVYRDDRGNPLEVAPGPTWVLVVPLNTKVEIK